MKTAGGARAGGHERNPCAEARPSGGADASVSNQPQHSPCNPPVSSGLRGGDVQVLIVGKQHQDGRIPLVLGVSPCLWHSMRQHLDGVRELGAIDPAVMDEAPGACGVPLSTIPEDVLGSARAKPTLELHAPPNSGSE